MLAQGTTLDSIVETYYLSAAGVHYGKTREVFHTPPIQCVSMMLACTGPARSRTGTPMMLTSLSTGAKAGAGRTSIMGAMGTYTLPQFGLAQSIVESPSGLFPLRGLAALLHYM